MKGGFQKSGGPLPAPLPPITDNLLYNLGFEDGELEIFRSNCHGINTDEDLVNKYLEIARSPPYILVWQDITEAENSNNELGIFNDNSREYKKHDIALDTLNSFGCYTNSSGGRAKRIRNKMIKRKHRTNKKKQGLRRKTRRRTLKRR